MFIGATKRVSNSEVNTKSEFDNYLRRKKRLTKIPGLINDMMFIAMVARENIKMGANESREVKNAVKEIESLFQSEGVFELRKPSKPRKPRTPNLSNTNFKKGDDVFGYFIDNYMGLQLVDPRTEDSFVMDGKILSIVTEDGIKKLIIKFENGVTKKYPVSIAKQYLKQNY